MLSSALLIRGRRMPNWQAVWLQNATRPPTHPVQCRWPPPTLSLWFMSSSFSSVFIWEGDKCIQRAIQGHFSISFNSFTLFSVQHLYLTSYISINNQTNHNWNQNCLNWHLVIQVWPFSSPTSSTTTQFRVFWLYFLKGSMMDLPPWGMAFLIG